jgi:dethiobiotin synthetase
VSVLVVTGTGTEIGKTVVTAAIAATASAAGQGVAVVKAAQTGVGEDDEPDVAAVTRLSGVTDVHELARYPEPLAPATAARRAGVAALSVPEMAATIRELAATRDLTIVEGAGGLLVQLDEAERTVADLATELDAPVLVVTSAGLGALNLTALTCEAIRHRGLDCVGVVIGAWPAQPDLAASCNMADLAGYGSAPLLGALPERAGRLSRPEFLAVAQRNLGPRLAGSWSPP